MAFGFGKVPNNSVKDEVMQLREEVQDLKRNIITLLDVIQKSGKQNQPSRIETKSTELTVSVPKLQTTTAGVPNTNEEIVQEIKALIKEMSTRFGLKYGLAWKKAYRLLYDDTGFDVYKSEKIYVRGKPNMIRTVVSHGKAEEMLMTLRKYLDKVA